MKVIIRVLVSIAVVATLFALGTYYYLFKAGDTQALEELFPANTIAYSDIKHVRELGVKAATSDLVSTYEELLKVFVGAVAAVGSELSDSEIATNQKLPDINGEDLLKFGIYFNRQISMGAIPKTADDESKIAIPSVITVAHFQGKKEGFEQEVRSFTDKINQSLDAESQVSWMTEDWNSNQLHILKVPESEEVIETNDQIEIPDFKFCWAVIETKFYASLDIDSLKAFIETSETLPIENSLAQNEEYNKISDLPVEQDIVAFANTSEFMPMLVELVDRTIQEEGGNTMGISFKAIMEDVGLLSIKSAYSIIDFTPQNERFASGVELSSKPGIWSLIDVAPSDDSIPNTAPTGIYSASSFGFDLGEFILWIKDLALKNAPIAAIAYPQYKANIDAYLGMDIETFLDEAFTRNMQMYTDISISKLNISEDISTSIPNSTFIIIQEIGTPDLFESKLEELIQPLEAQNAIPTETVEYEGIVYRKMDIGKLNPQSSDLGLDMVYCLTVTNNKMVFGYGSESLFQKSLSLIVSNGPGAFQVENVQTSLSALPVGEGAVQLIDVQRIFNVLSTIFLDQIEQQRETAPSTAKTLEQIDWEALKNIELKFVSKSYETESGLHSISKIVQSN